MHRRIRHWQSRGRLDCTWCSSKPILGTSDEKLPVAKLAEEDRSRTPPRAADLARQCEQRRVLPRADAAPARDAKDDPRAGRRGRPATRHRTTSVSRQFGGDGDDARRLQPVRMWLVSQRRRGRRRRRIPRARRERLARRQLGCGRLGRRNGRERRGHRQRVGQRLGSGGSGSSTGPNGDAGGYYDTGTDALDAAEQCQIGLDPSKEFIFDIQTHFVSNRTNIGIYSSFFSALPNATCGLTPVQACFEKNEYLRQILLEQRHDGGRALCARVDRRREPHRPTPRSLRRATPST